MQYSRALPGYEVTSPSREGLPDGIDVAGGDGGIIVDPVGERRTFGRRRAAAAGVVETERRFVTLPNFIVIGAAKAGTTALYWYLAEHPAVFMSPVKETNYFAYGVDAAGHLLYGDPEHHTFPVRTLAEYEQLFAEAAGQRAIGEASPIYLECPQAAQRIRDLLPAAQLICALRHPVERDRKSTRLNSSHSSTSYAVFCL